MNNWVGHNIGGRDILGQKKTNFFLPYHFLLRWCFSQNEAACRRGSMLSPPLPCVNSKQGLWRPLIVNWPRVEIPSDECDTVGGFPIAQMSC